MMEKTFLEENFKQLHEDVKNLTKEFQAFLVRFAVFEEQRTSTAKELSEIKHTFTKELSEQETEIKMQKKRIDDLELSLSYYKGAIAVIYVLLLPIIGGLITLIIKTLLVTSSN